MSRQPRYSKDVHAQLGQAIYEQNVRPRMESTNHGRVVASDVETAEFELSDNVLTASQSLLQRLPDAQIWCVRIGYDAVHRFGPCSASAKT